MLTRRSKGVPFLGRLKCLFHSLGEGRFLQPRGTPYLQLYVGFVVQAVSEQDRGQIDVREVASIEVVEPVSCQVLRPFRSSTVIQLWVRIARRGHCV
jgi:hypothetical protein